MQITESLSEFVSGISAYRNALQRLCDSSSVNALEEELTTEDVRWKQSTVAENKCSESDLFTLDATENVSSFVTDNAASSFQFTAPLSIRLECLHSFLMRWLPAYAARSFQIVPPKFLDNWSVAAALESVVPVTRYKGNTIPDPVGENLDAMHSSTAARLCKLKLVEPKSDQMCIQWYQTSFQPSTKEEGQEIWLLTTSFSKPRDYRVAKKAVNISELLSLHRRSVPVKTSKHLNMWPCFFARRGRYGPGSML